MNKRILLCKNGIVDDSIVDGPGYRMTIFVQGCPHNCYGCHNPESHDFHKGEIWLIDDIESKLAKNKLLDGITISGGEPFCQPGPCAELAKRAHKHGLNVWVYSGYTYERLLAISDPDVKTFLDEIDVLVDGPFILTERSLDLQFKGSRNQRIIDLKTGKTIG